MSDEERICANCGVPIRPATREDGYDDDVKWVHDDKWNISMGCDNGFYDGVAAEWVDETRASPGGDGWG